MIVTTDETRKIWQVVKETLLPKISISKQGVRLLGVGISKLNNGQTSEQEQLDLFGNSNQSDSDIDKLTDNINKKFGMDALKRGTTVKK